MVTLYSTHCPRCNVLKAKLEAENIEYIEETDVDLMQSLGFTSIPKLKVGDEILDFMDALDWIKSMSDDLK